ncbi:hypothetical protein BC827DRAFT_504528 [Russula dissimulans]|nr:hypothetical protein BC827DRAFT_504528 [Russula dissimulans]
MRNAEHAGVCVSTRCPGRYRQHAPPSMLRESDDVRRGIPHNRDKRLDLDPGLPARKESLAENRRAEKGYEVLDTLTLCSSGLRHHDRPLTLQASSSFSSDWRWPSAQPGRSELWSRHVTPSVFGRVSGAIHRNEGTKARHLTRHFRGRDCRIEKRENNWVYVRDQVCKTLVCGGQSVSTFPSY